MSTERDTHFQGWARNLREKIIKACTKQVNALDDIDEEFFPQVLDVLIAQAGYDLAIHTLDQMSEGAESLSPEENLAIVPDLTQWPDSS
jgi:hypothetical protein